MTDGEKWEKLRALANDFHRHHTFFPDHPDEQAASAAWLQVLKEMERLESIPPEVEE